MSKPKRYSLKLSATQVERLTVLLQLAKNDDWLALVHGRKTFDSILKAANKLDTKMAKDWLKKEKASWEARP